MARGVGHEVVTLLSDLTDGEAVQREVLAAAPDAVVHLAAISFVDHADKILLYDVNVFGTINLLESLVQLPQPPRVVLLASSANVYGNCENSPISEKQIPAPVNHYAMSKLAMESIARNYFNLLPILIARPFNYTGPGQSAHFIIPKLIGHFVERLPVIDLGNLHVEREFNDVKMVCNAYLHLLKHGEPTETYNVCSGQAYTIQHVINTLTGLTGHEIQARVNPAFVRAAEVHRLCGSPAKIQTLLKKKGVQLSHQPLEAILKRMLSEFIGKPS